LVLLFLLLAGLIPETIVTNSTSVAKIAHAPIDLIFIALFYGTADIVIREAIIRRPLGLASKVLLGVAFGFINEGVVAGTWYTVRPDGYVYLNGIDVSWAVSLTIFHLFVSVLLPIYLFDSVAPSVAGVPLLKRRGIITMTLIFLGLSALVFLTPLYRPQRLAVFAVALTLAVIALLAPPALRASVPASETRPAPGLWRLRILGFLALLLYFICIYLLPVIFAAINKRAGGLPALPALLANVILIGLVVWSLALGVGWSRRRGWSSRHSLALISGVLTFSVLFSFIPPLVATWEPLATVPFAIFLIILAWRARNADRRARLAAPPLEGVA
jgi:hypothetical protein